VAFTHVDDALEHRSRPPRAQYVGGRVGTFAAGMTFS
jgi:hypothetical protein